MLKVLNIARRKDVITVNGFLSKGPSTFFFVKENFKTQPPSGRCVLDEILLRVSEKE